MNILCAVFIVLAADGRDDYPNKQLYFVPQILSCLFGLPDLLWPVFIRVALLRILPVRLSICLVCLSVSCIAKSKLA